MNTGSGKTAVIQALAKELGIELVGWENPVESISYHDKNRWVFYRFLFMASFLFTNSDALQIG